MNRPDYFIFAGTFCIASVTNGEMGCWVTMQPPFIQTTGLLDAGYNPGAVKAWVVGQVSAPYNTARGIDISDSKLITIRENKEPA